MTDAELGIIALRAGAATPGPWYRDHDMVRTPDGPAVAQHITHSPGDRDTPPVWLVGITSWMNPMDKEANTEFIAHAREDIPALLAEIKRLRFELDAALDSLPASPIFGS